MLYVHIAVLGTCCWKIQRWTNLNGNRKTPLIRHNNCKFASCPTHTKTQVIRTKPMLMVLDWSAMIFNLETWVTWSRSSTYWFVNIDPCFAFERHGFLECKTLNCRFAWARHQHKHFPSTSSHLKIVKVANH